MFTREGFLGGSGRCKGGDMEQHDASRELLRVPVRDWEAVKGFKE